MTINLKNNSILAAAAVVGAIGLGTGTISPPVALGTAIITLAATKLWKGVSLCRKNCFPNEAILKKFQFVVKTVHKIHKIAVRHKELAALRKYDLQSIMNNGSRMLSPLKVLYIKHSNLEQVMVCLYEWLKQANKYEDSDLKGDAIEVLYSFIYENYKYKNKSWVAAEDLEGTWQAFGVCDFNSDQPEFNLLVSNPQNAKDRNPSKRGAGSATLSHIVRSSLLFNKKRISLQPTKTGRPYYRNQGFREYVNHRGIIMSNLSLHEVLKNAKTFSS